MGSLDTKEIVKIHFISKVSPDTNDIAKELLNNSSGDGQKPQIFMFLVRKRRVLE